MSGSIIRDSFWLGIPIYFSFENLFLQICTSAWYKTVTLKKEKDFSSCMAGALRAKRGEWGLSRKARDEDHLTLCVGVSRFARNITPPGLAHKGPVKAGAFLWGCQLGDSDVWFLSATVNCVCERQNRYKKRLHCEYCNQDHLDKAHRSDYRKITIDFEKVGCGLISSS